MSTNTLHSYFCSRCKRGHKFVYQYCLKYECPSCAQQGNFGVILKCIPCNSPSLLVSLKQVSEPNADQTELDLNIPKVTL